MFRFFIGLSRFFGSQRLLIRRVAALSLLVIGVHHSADLLDDVVYLPLDRLDLFLDQSVFALCDWLAQKGAFDALEGAKKAERFSEFMGENEKDIAAKWLALFLELVVDIMLLEFVWGKAPKEQSGMFAEFKHSLQELKAALWPLDLERLAVPFLLFCFTITGALFAGNAVETVINSEVTQRLSKLDGATNIAAFLGILTAGILLMRFLPDLLQGAFLRSAQRAERFKEKQLKRVYKGPAFWRSFRKGLAIITRGSLYAFLLLPLALFGLLSSNIFFQLLARVGGDS